MKGVVHVAHTSSDLTAGHLTISLPMRGYLLGDLFKFLADGTDTGPRELHACAHVSNLGLVT